jgi:Autotransporter beta-domain
VPQGDRGLRLPLSLVELRRAVSAQLRAEFNANAWSGRIEGGYRLVSPWRGGVGITPYAAGQFTTFELPAYAESVVSGAGMFALSYAALPGASFVVNGAAHAANSALTTASAGVKWINGWRGGDVRRRVLRGHPLLCRKGRGVICVVRIARISHRVGASAPRVWQQ